MSGKRRKGKEPDRQTPPPSIPPSIPPSVTPPPSVPSLPSASVDPMAVVIAPQLTRRQARAERRKQRNRRVGLAGGAAIVAVALVLVGVGVFVGPKVAHHLSGSDKPTQTTVLMQVQGPDSTAQASVLLAQGPGAAQGVEVLIPGRVISDVCGYGLENFADLLALPNGEAASRQAVTSMLGDVTVDGSWILSPTDLAKLVDSVGGIKADVDTNVVRRNANGTSTVLVPAGNNQQLTGQQAAEYATYVASSQEDASAQQARLQQVVDGLLAALPQSQSKIAALLHHVGPAGASTLGVDRLSGVLAGLAAANGSQSGLFPTDLPVNKIDAGGAPSYSVDDTSSTGVHSLVSGHLADSVPPGGDKPRPTVLLLNGIGTPGLVLSACPKLTAHGLAYAGSSNAATFSDTARSIVEIQSDSDVALGDQVARALGLPSSDVERNPGDQTVANVIVTLGSDYKP